MLIHAFIRFCQLVIPRSSHAVLRLITDDPGVWPLHCHIGWHLAGKSAVVFHRGLVININCVQWERWRPSLFNQMLSRNNSFLQPPLTYVHLTHSRVATLISSCRLFSSVPPPISHPEIITIQQPLVRGKLIMAPVGTSPLRAATSPDEPSSRKSTPLISRTYIPNLKSRFACDRL